MRRWERLLVAKMMITQRLPIIREQKTEVNEFGSGNAEVGKGIRNE